RPFAADRAAGAAHWLVRQLSGAPDRGCVHLADRAADRVLLAAALFRTGTAGRLGQELAQGLVRLDLADAGDAVHGKGALLVVPVVEGPYHAAFHHFGLDDPLAGIAVGIEVADPHGASGTGRVGQQRDGVRGA